MVLVYDVTDEKTFQNIEVKETGSQLLGSNTVLLLYCGYTSKCCTSVDILNEWHLATLDACLSGILAW